jgi:hypothetical protein
MDENKIEMTDDIEYFLNKAKAAIEDALLNRDPMLCLSHIRQAEITLRSHVVYLQPKKEQEN